MFPQIIQLLHKLGAAGLFFGLHFDGRTVFPRPLSAAEERECFESMSKGDKSAREKLIRHNLRLVAHIIKKYYAASSDQDDLISIGTIGLIKAVQTFDYTKGTRFATYGSRCVENEILMHFRSLKKSAGDVSIEEPAQSDKDGNSLSLMDLLTDGEDLGDRIELLVQAEQVYKDLDKCLDDREREVIVKRYGLFGTTALTQREAAKKLGISRSYVSRIEKRALEKLRERLR
ncbi:RNA polymerase sporulation sigma factor SigK [Ruminococcus sp.]|uniref:RNA polymerase sporulation sigma factor SigK n=1 Tax=Ruminococcus sp. TaxID=41978 RepID=UPI0025E2DF14|nr:RNA polymerase sporulation sigma factor SigK [Ruminococcus sp.]MBQ8967450.1 RNA polymerase sporulation sigma factor SigK [Ruminococcus sp.]